MTKKQQEILLMVLGNITEYADDEGVIYERYVVDELRRGLEDSNMKVSTDVFDDMIVMLVNTLETRGYVVV